MSAVYFEYRITRKKFAYFILRICILTPIIPAVVLYIAGKKDLILNASPYVYIGLTAYLLVSIGIAVWLILNPNEFKFAVSNEKVGCVYPNIEHLTYEVSLNDIVSVTKKIVVGSAQGLHYQIVTRDGRSYEIPKNYNNPVGKCIDAILTANPRIKYEEVTTPNSVSREIRHALGVNNHKN